MAYNSRTHRITWGQKLRGDCVKWAIDRPVYNMTSGFNKRSSHRYVRRNKLNVPELVSFGKIPGLSHFYLKDEWS